MESTPEFRSHSIRRTLCPRSPARRPAVFRATVVHPLPAFAGRKVTRFSWIPFLSLWKGVDRFLNVDEPRSFRQIFENLAGSLVSDKQQCAEHRSSLL